jgi:diguanylate cyclase (GGDEF)-like protein
MTIKHRLDPLLPITVGFAIVLILMLNTGFRQSWGIGEWLGTIIALLAIGLSILLIRVREAALLQAVAQSEDTLNALEQGILRMDADCRVTYLNPAASRMLGNEPGQLPVQINLIDHSTRQSLFPSMLAQARDGDLAPIPPGARLLTPQGIELEVEGSCRALQDDQGKVQIAILQLHDVTEEREWTRRQPDLWDRDPLTSLPGRNFMLHRLNRVTERVRAGERPIAYLRITLDGIQHVYQNAGVKAGDTLIRYLAELLRTYVRDTDLLARMDKHEFGALLLLCPKEVADRIAADILAALASSRFHWQNKSYEIKARLGHIQIPPFEGTVEELLAAAGTDD